MKVKDRTYTEGSRDFYLGLPDHDCGSQRVAIQSPTGPRKDSGIRLHSVQHNSQWQLQIRAFFRTANYRKGKKWYYASASLGVDELRALRSACDDALAEIE